MIHISDDITILYVEDEESIRDGYTRALKRISDKVYIASDGAIGLEIYKKYTPDIVISDIKMPNMNGIEMVKKIKEININANIIFTTAHSESSYLLEAIELQVEGYLLKPVQKNKMLELIRKLAHNITLERKNEEQKVILQHIIDSENSISVITDMKIASFASKSFLNLIGVENIEELNTKFTSIIDIVADSDSLINRENILESINKGNDFYQFIQSIDESNRIAVFKDSSGDDKSFYINVSKINKLNFLINLTDITKLEKDREDTQKRVYTDTLTKVYSRNKFEEIFEYEAKYFKRYKEPFSIAILDIDLFKKFNDNFGHLVGDEILIMLAQAVDTNMRETDLFARWGGEEFVMLFKNTNLENSIILTHKLKDIIENIKHKTAGGVTASFGVTQFVDGDDIKSIFKRADEALYDAKESGRNCVKSKM